MSINEIITSNISHYLGTRKGSISNSYKSNGAHRSLPLPFTIIGATEHFSTVAISGGPHRPPIQTLYT